MLALWNHANNKVISNKHGCTQSRKQNLVGHAMQVHWIHRFLKVTCIFKRLSSQHTKLLQYWRLTLILGLEIKGKRRLWKQSAILSIMIRIKVRMQSQKQKRSKNTKQKRSITKNQVTNMLAKRRRNQNVNKSKTKPRPIKIFILCDILVNGFSFSEAFNEKSL